MLRLEYDDEIHFILHQKHCTLLTAELSLKKAIFRTCCQVGAERFEWFMSHFAVCECSAYRNEAFHSEVMLGAAATAAAAVQYLPVAESVALSL